MAATEASMDLPSIQEFADKKVLYLTTIGRTTCLPRQIEIWFVVYRDHFYLLAETGEAAAWVKNIRCNPEVGVRIAERQIGAMARVLSREPTASCGISSLQLPIANMDGGTGCRRLDIMAQKRFDHRIHLVGSFELVEMPGADGAAIDDIRQPIPNRVRKNSVTPGRM